VAIHFSEFAELRNKQSLALRTKTFTDDGVKERRRSGTYKFNKLELVWEKRAMHTRDNVRLV
jgi:hypothetical protein